MFVFAGSTADDCAGSSGRSRQLEPIHGAAALEIKVTPLIVPQLESLHGAWALQIKLTSLIHIALRTARLCSNTLQHFFNLQKKAPVQESSE